MPWPAVLRNHWSFSATSTVRERHTIQRFNEYNDAITRQRRRERYLRMSRDDHSNELKIVKEMAESQQSNIVPFESQRSHMIFAYAYTNEK